MFEEVDKFEELAFELSELFDIAVEHIDFAEPVVEYFAVLTNFAYNYPFTTYIYKVFSC